MIQIVFSFQTQFGEYRDALNLPDDHGMTEEEISAMKQQRLDNWLAIITAPQSEATQQ